MPAKRTSRQARPRRGKTTPLTRTQLVRLKTLPAGEVVGICKNQTIPVGLVIVGEGLSLNCSGPFKNVWYVKRPGPVEVVCSVSSIPPDYVIIAAGRSVECPGVFPNTRTIRKI